MGKLCLHTPDWKTDERQRGLSLKVEASRHSWDTASTAALALPRIHVKQQEPLASKPKSIKIMYIQSSCERGDWHLDPECGAHNIPEVSGSTLTARASLYSSLYPSMILYYSSTSGSSFQAGAQWTRTLLSYFIRAVNWPLGMLVAGTALSSLQNLLSLDILTSPSGTELPNTHAERVQEEKGS